MTTVNPTRDEILAQLRTILANSFELAPERITLEAHLFTDLDLDSIDAVELAIQLQEITGRRVKAEEFKHVRTVADVVEAVHQMLQAR
ncbi:acyl carrier protein [Mesoterricola silvestris]|uniref:Acyl carrier protein n=1 Tax=Mesoterricola silvestris TaxID=2927979 RepID=A0AA48KAF0_9BACT|nr:acyl carrier protein [Mesoterricola silvestris]BDU71453.1 acyl carrier protein [Mesoterricola silvestris]